MGSGRYGKGVLCNLLDVTMGGYAHTFESAMLTCERQSFSSPPIDPLNLHGKYWVGSSEPEKDKTINRGLVKFLTGNEKITGLYNYQNTEVTIYPHYSLELQCYSIPSLDGDDNAIWDVGRIIDFVFEFVDSPVGEYQRKIDRTLESKAKA
ncbi:hypothetical protein BDK51DRAFT_25821 [Blyttiomyces helicus]|uniref:Uncharacterized protein n=1 Tax=Blyttiomyces helicus TaxID=388810 RepID=A0A4P9WPZ1_9FUNG|nr:hypothetical protein BDK51DRAFT_25821 [Blyttiomyces helicus]|eukprot:RKO93838.1 hypothetical protein BDK51DRAFT_25821 [Blyttiomyces helicus]